MKYGFVKVAAVSPKLKVADTEYNALEIIKEIKLQAEKFTRLIVFPELCICGYTCADLFNQQVLLTACKEALKKIAEETNGIKALIFVGLPFEHGGKLYNCAAVINDGKLLAVIPKTHLPNYNEFYEKRHFVPYSGKTEETSNFVNGGVIPFGRDIIFTEDKSPEFSVACEICEDLWVPAPPSQNHALNGANIIVNLSASNETIGKREYRRAIINTLSAKCLCGYVYADAGVGESTTDMVFAGHDIISEYGNILAESELFTGKSISGEIDVEKLASERRKTTTFDMNTSENYTYISFSGDGECAPLTRKFDKTPFVPSGIELKERTELILSMQANALAKRLRHTNAKTAVVGISGGLDSTLALVVTARAFDIINKDKSEIIAVTMPGFGTTGRTFDNALKLIDCIGATSRTVNIAESVLKHFEDIGHDKDVLDVTYENAQARTRTLILMDIANKTGGLVIGTGDLSELALGWCTYNGDHMSMYGVNSSVPKTLVKHLVRSEGEKTGGKLKEVLDDILSTEISPELLPPDKDGKIAQKTEDIVGPYELHDFYLYYAIRWGFSPEKVYFLAQNAFGGKYTNDVLKKWLVNFYKRFFSQQFKRSCIPDGVKIGSVALSPRGDWRMPSDAVSSLWIKRAEVIKTE